MSRSLLQLLISCFLALILTPIVVFGQNTELCEAFISEAFRSLSSNCANLNSNELCYGFGNSGDVTATFYVNGTAQVVRSDVLIQEADRVSLIDAGTLETVEAVSTRNLLLDTDNDGIDENRWGIVIQEVPANLPNQLIQNTAILIVFGGARIENGVFPQNALVLLNEPINVAANNGTAVFGSPQGLGYTVPSIQVGVIGGVLQADGISPDGAWVRIFFRYQRDFGERTTAWVRISDLEGTEGIETLPVIGPNTYTPMQKIYLTNTTNGSACSDVIGSGLLIQGPGNIETEITVNDVPMRLTSTAFVQQISSGQMQIIGLSGITILFPDTVNEIIIPPGFTYVINFTALQSLGIDGVANDLSFAPNSLQNEPNVLPRELFGILDTLSRLSDNILNYGILRLGLACPSGVGSPSCTIQLAPTEAARIQQACAERKIAARACARYGF